MRSRKTALKAMSRLPVESPLPNYGDFTKIEPAKLGRVDILCGGTPCQAFSVAGLRQSLDDARGNLSLEFVRLAHELAAGNGLRNVIWENVVGVLSTKDNAFGCFLGGLVGATAAIEPPTRGKWGGAGMVTGPKGRAAWRIQDAQYHGVAQRRRRVLVVADFGNGADPSKVLFEPDGVQRHFAPSREAGKDVAGATAGRAGSGGAGVASSEVAPCLRAQSNASLRLDTEAVVAMPVAWSIMPQNSGKDYKARQVEVSQPLMAGGPVGGNQGGDYIQQPVAYAPEIARCVATREGSSQDYETTTMVAVRPINTMIALRHKAMGERTGFGIGEIGDPAFTLTKGHSHAVCVTGDIPHTLKAEGSDASEDGTGRGTPIIAFSTAGDVAPTMTVNGDGHTGYRDEKGLVAVAFVQNSRDEVRLMNGDGKIVGALAAEPGAKQQCYIAQTVAIRGRDGFATAELGGEVATALRASQGGGDKPHVLAFGGQMSVPQVDVELSQTLGAKNPQAAAIGSAVRRLTPTECERLQGFPDGYTDIPWRGKPTSPDGPRYKALGNSWAVPKFVWLGTRIAMHMPALEALEVKRAA